MKCTACGYANAEGLRVCGACLAPLGEGAANVPGATAPPGVGSPGKGVPPIPPADALRKRLEGEIDPGLVPGDVLDLYEKGRRVAAHAALRRRLGEDTARRSARQALLDDRRLWAQPARAPGMFTFNGVGSRPSGSEDVRSDGSFILTNWFVILFIPIWPLAAYVVMPGGGGWRRSWYFLAQVPVSEANLRWGRNALAIAAVCIAAFVAFVIVDP